jgi:hypothetical protein
MPRKIERVYRDRKLSPEEVARDEQIRRRVEAEFPPARPAGPSAPDSLSETLKEAIRHSKLSVYQIAKDAGVSQIVLSRFLSGERDIRMATADRVAAVLGLQLRGISH